MKTQVAENFQDIGVGDLKIHPELLTKILFQDQDVSLILEKRGQKIRYAYLRTYDAESHSILEEANADYLRKKNQGYSREQAFQDFEDAQQEIAMFITNSEI